MEFVVGGGGNLRRLGAGAEEVGGEVKGRFLERFLFGLFVVLRFLLGLFIVLGFLLGLV